MFACMHLMCMPLWCLDLIFPDVQSWKLCVGDAVWLRNQVVAPLTEELVFRGAMLPMLVPCTGPTTAIFIAPLFFGVGMTLRYSGWKKKQQFKVTFTVDHDNRLMKDKIHELTLELNKLFCSFCS